MSAFTHPPLPTSPARPQHVSPMRKLPKFFDRAHLRSRSTRAVPTATASASTRTLPQSTTFASLFPTAADSAVQTPNGEETTLIQYVQSQNEQNKPVLLGWLRHYGCTLCKKQASDWKLLYPRLLQCTNDRLAIALIGNGKSSQAVDFRNELNWEADLFTDPSNRTYKVLELRRGVGVTFTLPGLFKVIQSFREGNSQTLTRIPSDPFQQGGAILVDENGIVKLFHADQFAGDHADLEMLVDKVCSIC